MLIGVMKWIYYQLMKAMFQIKKRNKIKKSNLQKKIRKANKINLTTYNLKINQENNKNLRKMQIKNKIQM